MTYHPPAASGAASKSKPFSNRNSHPGQPIAAWNLWAYHRPAPLQELGLSFKTSFVWLGFRGQETAGCLLLGVCPRDVCLVRPTYSTSSLQLLLYDIFLSVSIKV